MSEQPFRMRLCGNCKHKRDDPDGPFWEWCARPTYPPGNWNMLTFVQRYPEDKNSPTACAGKFWEFSDGGAGSVCTVCIPLTWIELDEGLLTPVEQQPMKQQQVSTIFKCEAQDDTLYFRARSLDEAKYKLTNLCGEIPESLLTWSEVDEVPAGYETIEQETRRI